MTQKDISNFSINKSRLGGLLNNTILLGVFLIFCFLGRFQINLSQNGLLKEMFVWLTGSDMICVNQFMLDELSKIVYAANSAASAIWLGVGLVFLVKFTASVVGSSGLYTVAVAANRFGESAAQNDAICVPVYSFCLKYKE